VLGAGGWWLGPGSAEARTQLRTNRGECLAGVARPSFRDYTQGLPGELSDQRAESSSPARELPGNRQVSATFVKPALWHRHRSDDDAMMRALQEPMTVAQLKRSMDARFRTVDKHFQSVDRRFQSVDRRFQAVDRRFARLEREMARTRREISRSAEETRRHFDIVAESLRDDFRIFADGIAGLSERLDKHEIRIARLERRTLPA
jgi:hypothetical protein